MRKYFDVFLSYSSSERDSCVLPFRARLEEAGIITWCDVHDIAWGDSIVAKINEGLAGSTFVIAFISKTYLSKPWPLKELNASLASHAIESALLLPVFLGVSAREVHAELPLFSDTKHMSVTCPTSGAVIDDESLGRLIEEIQRRIERTRGLVIVQSFDVGRLGQPVSIVNYSANYQSVWMSSKERALDVDIRPVPSASERHHSPDS